MSAEERMDTEEEGGGQESPNCEEESEIEDSDRSTASDTESSDLDEETIDVRKTECIANGQELEHAFQLVKNLLYDEKMKKIEFKLVGVKNETAPEYLQPIKQLTEKFGRKLKVCEIRRDLRLKLIKVQNDSEIMAAHQNLENDKHQLYDTVKNELNEKIRRLEEDRHNIDIHSDLWESQVFPKKSRAHKGTPSATKERRKKPVIVTNPYIIYMLKDLDIIEDWTLIKKAVKQKQQEQRRTKKTTPGRGSLLKDKYVARFYNGKLNYQGDHYNKGHRIIIDDKKDMPVYATITDISPDEICVKKADGNKSKLLIPQLQKGKYMIRHVTT